MREIIMLSILGAICWFPYTGHSQTYDLGEINSARYKIYIPGDWNGGLVIYAHGYEEIGEEVEGYSREVDDFMEIFTSHGFAYAESAYKRQGLIIKDGIEDSEALRSYFELKYGKPDICIITGHSMGGIISLAMIEKYPAEYDGALPLCGWLSPVYSLIKNGLDMLASYDYLFGKNDGEIVTGADYIDAESIQENLSRKPDLAGLFANRFHVRMDDIADVIAFNQLVLKECTTWLGGLPAGNIQTIYEGFGKYDGALNREILRYAADPGAKEYYINYYTPTGILSDPVLALHTVYDELSPVSNYQYYEQLTEIKRTADYYVQQYVVSDGHCEFTTGEVADAFDQLLKWIWEGQRPGPIYR
jgi:pimeloyl-ACP methyl ester carboxylesterase